MQDMTEVTSSVIAAYGYNPTTKTLAVQFKRGIVYLYEDVPADVVAEFSAADSIGKAYTDLIRGQYKHEVEDGDPAP